MGQTYRTWVGLKEFFKNTISSISEAILESQQELQYRGVIVNAEKTEIVKTGERLLRSDGWRYVQELNFYIFVGVEEKQGNSGKGELKVAIPRLFKNIYIIHSYQFLLITR